MLDYKQYADKYGMTLKDERDDEGNRNDNEHDNLKAVLGHQANNYDMRRTHEMLQDEGFRDMLKEDGYKRVDKLAKQNMPSTEVLGLIEKYGKDKGTHNGKGTFDLRDQGASAKAFFNAYTDNFKDSIKQQHRDPENTPEPDAPPVTEAKSEPSEAQTRVSEFEDGMKSGESASNMYNFNYKPEGKHDFLSQYKDRIKKATGAFSGMTTDKQKQNLVNASGILHGF